ncbi:hypothetical protein JCM5350_007844 [Sporobolomyces pararoseus]
MTGTPHQEKVLAAMLTIYNEGGNNSSGGIKLELVYQLVRKRHPTLIAQLSDRVLKTAKKKLDELGVIKHVSSPFGTITEQAIKGIQSWKTKTGDDKEDDEQAASQFLQRGPRRNSIRIPRTVSQTPTPQTPSSASVSNVVVVKSAKGKEREREDDTAEESEEVIVGNGKKRSSTRIGADGGQSTKKPKLAIDVTKKKEKRERKKDVGSQWEEDDYQEAEEEEESNSPPGRKRRKTGPAGPGVTSLKREELLKKIEELEVRIEAQKKEEIGREGGKISSKGRASRITTKSVLVPTNDSSKGKGKEDESEELTDLEDSQVEEQIVQKILLPRSKSPAPILSPRHSTSTPNPYLCQRAVSADPLLLSHSLVRPSTSTSRRFSEQGGGGGGIALPVQSPQPLEVEQAGSKEKEIVVAEKAIQAALGIVPRPRQESESAQNKLPVRPKDGEDEEMNEAAAGDQTLVEIVEEEIEKKAPIVDQQLPIHEVRKEHNKVAAEAIVIERPPIPRQQPIPTVDPETLQELSDARQEIAKLRSIRNEMARERNDATEEKAELRRKLEKSQQEVEGLEKNLQAVSENRQAVSEEIRNEIDDLSKKLKVDQQTILLEQATKSNADLESQHKSASLSVTRLEGELKIAQEDLAQLEEERQNEVEELSKENRTKSEELKTVKTDYEALQIDVFNLGVSCSARIDQSSTPKTIINDLASRHVTLTEHLSLRDAGISQAMDVVRSLLEVLSSTRAKPPTPPSQTSTLEDLLKVLTVRISDVVRQVHQVHEISNEAGFIKAIADLVIAGGGAEIPTNFSQLPKAIEDVQKALVDKNTTILQLDAQLQATKVDLNESNLSHRTLESSLDQIQGELGDTTRRLDHL